jgi:putative DNA primase/helicase
MPRHSITPDSKAWTPAIAPDIGETRRHLAALDPLALAFTFQTFDDDAARKDASLARVLHGALADIWAELCALSARGAGAFVCVNATDLKGRKAENVTEVRAVWAELDGDAPASFPIEPTLTVETSPGRMHAYWAASGLTRDEHAAVMERMVAEHGSDPGAKDVARVLRLAGLPHQKDRSRPHKVRITGCGGRHYSRDELLTAFPPVARATTAPAARTPPPIDVVRDALRSVPADDRETWRRVLAALKHDYGLAGKELAADWSATCAEKWDPRDFERVWQSHDRDGGRVTTSDSILHMARERGWVDGRVREVRPGEFPIEGDGSAPSRPRPFQRGDHMSMAEAWLRGRHVVRWKGDWLEYDGSAYRRVEDEKMESSAWRWLDGQTVAGKDGPAPLRPNREAVANLLKAAAAVRIAPADAPCWLTPAGGDPAPSDVVSMRNGLLDLGTRRLSPPTPRFFTPHALAFDYDPSATAPRWGTLLEEVWPEETDQREALREMFGYILSGSTRLQKVFFIQGAPRSGKGTIARVLTSMIGEWNHCSPSLRNLGGDFGLQSLIGKSLALMSDIRPGKGADSTALLENILRISGEDAVTVQRKNKEDWIGTLGTRFLLIGNAPLQVRDGSGALLARLIALRCKVSFQGREDTTLTDKLLAELPGIFNWALDGLLWVRAMGVIEQPESARDLVEVIREVGNPIGEFLAEHCELGPRLTCTKKEVWSAFELWASEHGVQYTGSLPHFFKDLYEAAPVEQWGNGRSKLRGIALRAGSMQSE